MDLFLDSYERRARLTPGLLAVVPISATLATLGLLRDPVLAAALGVVSVGVGGYFLTVQVANAGRSRQDDLYREWGGAPTTQLLRAGEGAASATQRKIWRRAVQSVTGVKLLSAEAERDDPARSDEVILAAAGQLRYLGQDDRYPQIARENAQYGLERNLWGFRWFGRAIAVLCLLALLVVLALDHFKPNTALLVGLVIDVVMSVVWFTVPSAHRAKAAGFRYGDQLLNAVVRESKATTSGTTKKGKK